MCKQNFGELLLLMAIFLGGTQISTCEIVYRQPCIMSEDNKNCTITGLTLSLKNYKFMPALTSSSPNNVINFEITESTVPVLTSDICTNFPKIILFMAVDQGIEMIEDYAFNNCTEVDTINLEHNYIHRLGTGIFSNTKQLRNLHIFGASLDHIDVDLFENSDEMTELMISASGLKELPVAAIKNMKKLTELYIYSNELSDLDAVGFSENLPHLETVYINDNHFDCDRLIQIIDSFNANNIAVDNFILDTHIKNRDYYPGQRNGITCLSQAQLRHVNMKSDLTSSLDELKEYPIGKAVIQLEDVVRTGFINAENRITDAAASQTDNYNNLMSTTTHIIQALWVCLIGLLLCIIATVVASFLVYQKWNYFYTNTSAVSYKNESIQII